MRILLLTPDGSVHSKRFLQLLLEEGHTVTVAGRHDPRGADTASARYVPFPYQMDRVYRLCRIYRPLGRHLEWWIPTLQLWLIWRLVRPDIVNAHFVDERAWYCAKAGIRPLVLTCWGSDINCFFPPDARRDRQRQRITSAIAAADYVTADSQELLDRCEQLVGRKLRSLLVYFGIDTGRFKPGYVREAKALRLKMRIPSAAKVILSSRRLSPFLGQHHILEAFAEAVRDPHMPDTVLVFRRYLADTNVENELRSQAKHLGIERKLYWLDEAPYHEIPVQYAMADVVVNYPERDGFPVSLFEAVACRRPVISSDLPAYSGVFDGALFTVPPCDAGALARALKTCLAGGLGSWQHRMESALAIARKVGDARTNIRLMIEIFDAAALEKRKGRPTGQGKHGARIRRHSCV